MPSNFDILVSENMRLASSEQQFLLIRLKMCRVFIVLGFEEVISPKYLVHLGVVSCVGFCTKTVGLG